MPKDDLGIEFDDDVAQVINEPKSVTLMKFLNYWDARRVKEQEIAEDKKKKEQPEKFLGIF